MSVILPFNLSQSASSITSVVCLFDPSPAFQYYRNTDYTFGITPDANLNRDSSVALAGFSGTNIGAIPIVNINLPSNSYTINLPSQVYGTNPANDTYSVLQINTALANVEPGFSRIQVTYVAYNQASNTYSNLVEYFDCPFYEGFNVTARELNNLRDYIEEAVNFLQAEIDIIDAELEYALSHEFWRGISVSGQLTATPTTEGLQTGPLTLSEFPHYVPVFCKSNFGLTSDLEEKTTYPDLSGDSNLDLSQIVDANSYIQYGVSAPGLAKTPKLTSGSIVYGYFDNTNGNGPVKGSYLICENTDGTLTFMIMDDNYGGLNVPLTISQGQLDSHFPGSSINVQADVGSYKIANGGFTDYDSIAIQPTGRTVLRAIFTPNSSAIGATLRITLGEAISAYSGPSISLDTFNFSYTDGNGADTNGQMTLGGPSTTFAASNTNLTFASPTAAAQTISVNSDDLTVTTGSYPSNIFTISTGSISGSTETYVFTPKAIGSGSVVFTRSDNETVTVNVVVENPIPPAPTVSVVNGGLSANSACVGSSITVNGTNFTSSTTFRFGGTAATNFSINSGSSATVTIPAGIASGSQPLVVTNAGGSSAPFTFTVVGSPNLNSVSPTQSVAGVNITLIGNNFGLNPTVYFGSTQATIVSSSNTQIVAVTPTGLPTGNTQISVHGDCGSSPTLLFTVLPPDKVILNPEVLTLSAGTNYQFHATWYQGNTGTAINSPATGVTWQVNGVSGGEAIHGTITQGGLYHAPASQPSSQIIVTIVYYDTVENVYLSDSCVVSLTGSAQLTITPANPLMVGGQVQQFTVEFVEGGTATDVTGSSIYSVNGTTGGDVIDGFITTSGSYTAPGNFTSSTTENIVASYVYQGTTYTALAIATIQPTPATYSNITVKSQINIFLGDGRFGYIPTGTQIIAYPNQYIFVQFQEQLDNQNFLPVSTYLPSQQLSILVKNALDSDIGSTIYNSGDVALNADGTTNTLRTVVLGIIDPSDGMFHSMWDIANQIPSGSDNQYHSLPDSVLFGEEAKAFKGPHTFKGSLVDYVNDLSGGAQTQIDALNARSNIILAGNCSYDVNTSMFKILDTLNILGISNDKTYGILGLIPKQEVKLSENQYIYIDNNKTLQVGNFSEIFLGSRDSNTIVVGAVLDKFYTTWPLLKTLEVDTTNVNDFGQNSYMRVGELLIQWGLSEQYLVNKKSAITNKISFPVQYEKSCVVLTEAQNSTGGFPQTQSENITVKDFDAKLINLGTMEVTSNISWVSIGI